MSLDRADAPKFRAPIESMADLTAYFRAGETPPREWRIGTEHEKLGLSEADLRPVPYEGPRGIGALLERLAEVDAWTPIREGGKTIALRKGETAIMIEWTKRKR